MGIFYQALTIRNPSAFWQLVWYCTLILSTFVLSMTILQPVQELHATLYFLPVYVTTFCLHFLPLQGQSLNPKPRELFSKQLSPFSIHLSCLAKSTLCFIDLSSNKGLIPLGKITVRFVPIQIYVLLRVSANIIWKLKNSLIPSVFNMK